LLVFEKPALKPSLHKHALDTCIFAFKHKLLYRVELERRCRARGGEPAKIWDKLKYVPIGPRLMNLARKKVLKSLVGVTRHSIKIYPQREMRRFRRLVVRKAQQLAKYHGLKVANFES